MECTEKFEEFCIIRSWPDLREKAFKRDKYACVKCGKQPKIKESIKRDDVWEWVDTDKPDDSKLIADHIKPIAIGGEQWDIDNIQTLCVKCNKIKTKKDAADIAKARRIEKKLTKGQTQLK